LPIIHDKQLHKALQLDIKSYVDANKAVKQAEDLIGPIGILVNNAGNARLQFIIEKDDID
jgi:NADP-dependent 3-hydroxy acid dehydrogenase YdfG